MHKILIVLSLVLLASCKKQVEPVAVNENDEIEIYNYSQLEPLLNAEDDKIYVVNFWATWCAPCIKELPYFQELDQQYADDKLEVILVSLDFPDKFESQLLPFVKKKNIKPQVILLDDPDENVWIAKIDSTWSGALPATLIYNNKKRAFYQQAFTKETLFKEVENFNTL